MSFFAKLRDATIGFSGYARLLCDPRGGFGFMATLLAIVVAINGYMNMVALRQMTTELARQVETWPEFRIAGGQVEFAGPMPFAQTLPGGLRLVVDTTGQTAPESLIESSRGAVLVTRTSLYVIQPGLQPRATNLAGLQGELTRADLQQFLAARPERLLSFVYLFVYLAQLGFKALDAAILGLIAMLYAGSIRRPIPFDLGYRAGLYAMSLPIIIQWIWKEFTVFSQPGFLIWWMTAVIYLVFGLRAYLATATPPERLS